MRTIEQFVATEVHYCVSSLVSTLASGYGDTGNSVTGRRSDLADATEQALDLASPILVYEAAAIEAGWKSLGHVAEHDLSTLIHFEHADGSSTFHRDWNDLCDDEEIDPYDREVFEHWIVSDWLADRLAEQGEKVDKDFCGLTVWARTTTGQGIASDSVIERIYAALMAA